MSAHANPSQKNALPAAELLSPVGTPDPLEANAVSKSAFTALSNNYLDAIYSNANGNPQAVASFDARNANSDANAVNPDGSLNTDSTYLYQCTNDLYQRTEIKAQVALADAANPGTSEADLTTDEHRLASSVDIDLKTAALFTQMGKFGEATRLQWAAGDAGQALSDVELAERLRQQQS